MKDQVVRRVLFEASGGHPLRTSDENTEGTESRLIGAGEKTVVRWERGTVAQNKAADTLLRVLLDYPEVVAALKRQTGLSKPARRVSAPRPRKAKTAGA